jgi:hypothetical protein
VLRFQEVGTTITLPNTFPDLHPSEHAPAIRVLAALIVADALRGLWALQVLSSLQKPCEYGFVRQFVLPGMACMAKYMTAESSKST